MSPEVVWRRTLAVGCGSRLYRELMACKGKFCPVEMFDLQVPDWRCLECLLITLALCVVAEAP